MTPKQRRFVDEYLTDLNATQAAIRAGYSEKTAAAIGAENLIKPQIAAAIQEAMQARSARTLITADRVLTELARIAFSNMKTFAEWGGSGFSLKQSSKVSDEDAACVAQLSETTTKDGGSISFKLHDKVRALEKLGDHLGMFDQKKFEHDKEMQQLRSADLDKAIKELPSLVFFEHPATFGEDRPH